LTPPNTINPAANLSSAPNTVQEEDDEINLLELATALGEEKHLLFGIPTVTTLAAIVYALTVTPIYTAKTVLLPPQQQQSGASAMLASMGALAGVAGAAAGVKSPDDMYLAFLKSNTVKDDLIKQFNLTQRYESKTQDDARKTLDKAASISADKKSGLMSIAVDDKDPAFAAELANAHIGALSRLMAKVAVTEAQQRRVYFEQQVKNTQQALIQAESNFRTYSAKGGLQVSDVLAEVSVKTSATLRGQIAAKEVELSAMRQFATDQNPEMQRAASELAALRSQLSKVEEGGGRSSPITPDGQAAINALRDVKIQQSMLEVLVKQYEMARVDEAKEGPLLQQIDVAQPPERKSKPKRAQIVLLAGVAGLFLGIMLAFVRRAWRKAEENPESASQVSALKQAWLTGWLSPQKR
jgi:uncharacterized protein involved in exopolysaccharide biosynthesis